MMVSDAALAVVAGRTAWGTVARRLGDCSCGSGASMTWTRCLLDA